MHAVLAEVRRLIRESEPIHFDGNGYTEEWKAEAAVRGLDTETNPALIFDAYLRADSVEMFTRTGVLTPRELQARNEVKWEMYTKKIQIEARVLGDLAINHIIPVATRYLGILLDNMDKARRIFGETKGAAMTASDAESAESTPPRYAISPTPWWKRVRWPTASPKNAKRRLPTRAPWLRSSTRFAATSTSSS